MAIKSWLRIRAGLAYPTLLRWECRCDAVLEMVLAQGRARAPLIVLGRVLSVSLVLLSAPTQSLDLFVGGSSFASSDLAGLEGGLSVIVVVRVGLLVVVERVDGRHSSVSIHFRRWMVFG